MSTTERPLVCVVDDDESVREALPDLLRELGFTVQAYASAEDFLAAGRIESTRCLILDVAMPGMSGPDLQLELRRRAHAVPIVFITAHADQSVRRQMREEGAIDCLFKPFSESELLGAINRALERD